MLCQHAILTSIFDCFGDDGIMGGKSSFTKDFFIIVNCTCIINRCPRKLPGNRSASSRRGLGALGARCLRTFGTGRFTTLASGRRSRHQPNGYVSCEAPVGIHTCTMGGDPSTGGHGTKEGRSGNEAQQEFIFAGPQSSGGGGGGEFLILKGGGIIRVVVVIIRVDGGVKFRSIRGSCGVEDGGGADTVVEGYNFHLFLSYLSLVGDSIIYYLLEYCAL
mmetsp:Transcript_12405/g.17814  ORF Transcript_12405/g.17814 Transcript_12405/m.17814 type:complete len:219 (-) Transcript_12405:77-733(-)